MQHGKQATRKLMSSRVFLGTAAPDVGGAWPGTGFAEGFAEVGRLQFFQEGWMRGESANLSFESFGSPIVSLVPDEWPVGAHEMFALQE